MVIGRDDAQYLAAEKIEPIKKEPSPLIRIGKLTELEQAFSSEGNTDGIAFCVIEIAFARAQLKQYEEAITCLTEALELNVTSYVRGLLLMDRASIYNINGDYEKASIEMLDSKWATQVGRRALELSEILHKAK